MFMSPALRDLMAGHSQGLLPAALRGLLGVAASGYGVGIGWRNRRYDRGRGVVRAAVPVVSVGNLTAGGTGKTPVVAFLANHFQQADVKVCLLSRGYKSPKRQSGGNDEAQVLSRLCPGIPHLQQPDRVAAAAEAVTRFGAELLILDDGFQHRRLARDLDIVLVDATAPFGHGHLLPRGLLREPVTSLQRADLVLLTRANLVPPHIRAGIAVTLHDTAPELPVIDVGFPPTELIDAAGNRYPLDHLAGQPTLAFCGIGNPDAFAAMLTAANLTPANFMAFPDHHHYQPRDFARIAAAAGRCNAVAAVTTLKDQVKLAADLLPGLPVYAVETGCELLSDSEPLLTRLDRLPRRVTQAA